MKSKFLSRVVSIVLIFCLLLNQGFLVGLAHAAVFGTLTSTETVANLSAVNDQTAVTATTVVNVTAGAMNDQTATTATTVANVTEVKALQTLTVGALPAAAESIVVGTCTVTFADAGDDVDDVDCTGGVTVSRFTAPAAPRTMAQIATVLRTLTNVSDATHGPLAVGGSGSDSTFTTTNTETSATNITFTDVTVGDITNVAVTSVVAVAQVNTITIAGTVETGDIFTASLPGSVTATYIVTGADTTTSNIASGLNSAILASSGYAGQAFTSGVATNVITLTAKVAGTGFIQTSGAVNRAAVAQINTITISGTVEEGDVFTATLPTIGAVNYTVQAGDTTTANIATGLDSAIQASGGYATQDFTSGVSGSVITLTAKVAGTGFIQTSGTTNRTAIAQVVTFTPSAVTAGETFRGTINGSNYDYLAASGNTVATVVAALATTMDADGAVACVDTTSTAITCTASVAGTAFIFSSTVVDITAPSAFTAGTIVTTGGTIVSGKWNSTNTGVDITVPVANDASLTGGIIQLQAEADNTFVNLGSAYTILSGDLITGNKMISIADTELEIITGFTDSDNITFRAIITDSNNGGNATTGTISATSLDVDQSAPTVASVITKDTNGDGRAETATIVFSEAVFDSSFSASNFTIGGSTGTSFLTGSADDNTFDVLVSGGIIGTEAKDVTYTQGTGSDLVGNLLASVNSAAVTETDGANPVFMFARTFSTTQIDLTFSEDLDGSSLAMSDFTVSGYTLTGGVSEPTVGVARLTVSTPFTTGATPAVSVVGTVPDLASNNAITVSNITPIDGIAPILSSVNLVSDNTLLSVLFAKTGANVILTFTSSETINSPTVTFTSGGLAVTGSPTVSSTGNNWTAFYVANSADTEGSVAYNISFSDTSANNGVAVISGSGSVTFDKTNPGAAGTPTTSAPTNSVNQTWTWSAGSDALSGIYQYVWTIINNATSATVSSGTTNSSTLTLATNLAQGVWNLIVQTQDSAGNLSIASIGLVTVDTTNPLVSADNASSNWQTTSPTITLSVSDSGGAGLNSTRVRYNWNATADATTGTVYTNGTQITVPSEGTHTLNLYTEDTAGNANTFNGTYKIDTVAPTGTISAPSNNSFINVNPTFTVNSTDATSGVASVKFQYKASTAGSYTDLNTDTISTYAADWTGVTLVTNTVYDLKIIATDTAGNTTIATVSFTFDTTAPVLTITSPVSGTTTTPTVPVNLTTNETTSCTYSLDSGLATALSTTGGTTHSHSLSSLSTGSHTLQLTCTDLATNSTTSSSITFTVIASTGSTIDASTTSPSFDSATDGQADLPSGISSLTLSDTTNLNLANGVSSVSGGNITVGGSSIALNNFTSGSISGVNLTNAQSIGSQSVTVSKAVKLESGTNGSPVVLTNSSLSGASLSIPDGTTILGPSSWNGSLTPPKSGSGAGSIPSGFQIGGTVFEVGSPNETLLFDTPVSVILTGVNGTVAYKVVGSDSWVQISGCSGTYASPTAPAFPGECSITNGTDTKIFTYHLTSFTALEYPAGSTNSGTPVCTETKPGSAPKLLSADSIGANEVMLIWEKATDPVTYYLVAYGTSAGSLQYGNPNAGDKNTTSYTVKGLSGGKTYYFRVRAGNNCMPGDYSNEIAVAVGGGETGGTGEGFQEGVLGESTGSGEEGTEVGQVQGDEAKNAEKLPSEIAKKASQNKLLWGVAGVLLLGALGFYLLRKK